MAMVIRDNLLRIRDIYQRGSMPIEYTTSALSTETMWDLLQQRGASEAGIAEKTRRKNLAHDYLIQGLSITQISFMLGFTATSSFQVAFKRWYEQSPGDYRHNQLA